MIQYIIVDDESVAHDIIKGYCDALPNFSLVQHCYDAIEALECIRNNKIDLIFLDLNMPKLKGFDFLKTLQHPPKVIVTTAYQEHALEGYELNIVDYLLKPFGFDRFLKAVNKIDIKVNLENKQEERKLSDSFFVKSNKKLIQINFDEILFIEATGNYCKIITSNEEIQVREKISDFLELLSTNNFYQVHKSFIVSKKHIKAIEGNRISIEDYIVPFGKMYKNALTKLL